MSERQREERLRERGERAHACARAVPFCGVLCGVRLRRHKSSFRPPPLPLRDAQALSRSVCVMRLLSKESERGVVIEMGTVCVWCVCVEQAGP